MNKQPAKIVMPIRPKLRPLINTSDYDAADGSILEVHGYDEITRRHKVRRPTADGINPSRLLVAQGRVPAQSDGMGVMSFPSRILFDNADGSPATGQAYGTLTNSFRLKLGKFGFRAIAGVLANSSALFFPDNNCAATGSGSSSSSSGSTQTFYCCKCSRFTCAGPPADVFPDAMEVTVTSAIMGTRTLCMDRDTLDVVTGPYGCTKTAETGNASRVSYTGQYLGTYYDDTYFLNRCNSMVVESGIGYFDEYLVVQLGCCDTTFGVGAACQFEDQDTDTSFWIVNVQWQKLIGGVIHTLHISMPVDPVSCDPLSFTTTNTLVCDSATPGFATYCGDTDAGFASTRNDELVGDSVQVDLDETAGPCP